LIDPILALLAFAGVAACVGARLGWESHRGHALERVAWAAVGAITAASFAFGIPAACIDQANRVDTDYDIDRSSGRYQDR